MAYESITCRMSRSDPQIKWGFMVRIQGNQVVIASIEHEGLADKAGLLVGDIVERMNGVKVHGVSDVNREMDAGRHELQMNLQRFMAHPPSMPWSLTEAADSKLVLNEGYGTRSVPNVTSSISATSQSTWENPAFKEFNASNITPSTNRVFGSPSNYSSRYETTNSSYTKTEAQNDSGKSFTAPGSVVIPAMPPMAIPAGGSDFHYVHSTSTKSESKSTSGPGTNPADNYSVSTTSDYTNQSGVPPAGFNPTAPFPSLGQNRIGFGSSTGSGFGNTMVPFGSNARFGNTSSSSKGVSNAPFGGAPVGLNAAPIGHSNLGQGNFVGTGIDSSSGSFQDQKPGNTFISKKAPFGTNTEFHSGPSTFPRNTAGSVPLNKCTYIQTNGNPASSPFQKAQSLSPASRMRYNAPSPRTRTQLSPNSSVLHLQYNSPMNLYSGEAAAEQFSQQTGLPVSGVQQADTPYLSSPTRQTIAEEEGRFARAISPAVSPCFKRISKAVGTPVN